MCILIHFFKRYDGLDIIELEILGVTNRYRPCYKALVN